MALNGTEWGGFEDRLVVRAASGDVEAFEQLYTTHYQKVFTISRGILLNYQDTEDAVQEIFALAFRKLSQFDRRASFKTWIYRIAVNHSIQKARSLRRRHSDVPLDFAESIPAHQEVPTSDPLVMATLDQMKPDDRAILALFYWDELSIDEISRTLNCRTNAVKTRLYRARERFRALYEEALS